MASKQFTRAIHWFRRDLRLTDNSALARASDESAEVVPVYVVSEWRGRHHWTGEPRQRFLVGCLASLDANLRSVGSRLYLRKGDPVEELLALAMEAGVEAIFLNRDPDPHGRQVENRLAKEATALGIEVVGSLDHVLHGPDEVLTGAEGPYRVFTPYSRNWLGKVKQRPLGKLKTMVTPETIPSMDLPDVGIWGLDSSGAVIPEPGERAARRRMKQWLAASGGEAIAAYAQRRNLPSVEGTSRLGQDLRFGLLSIRELYARVDEAAVGASGEEERKSYRTYQTELAWREFYMSILHHFPEVLRHEFNPDWRGLPWMRGKEAEQAFGRWCRGETGFPIVDAGMRQLAATGFMHNRVRMIVSMFLTKDLHIDWRMGEAFFMRSLVDGEIASNNGGWQWSAGTGADAAPYFRIQNPWTQTKTYDTGGDYVKRWVPELEKVPAVRFFSQPKPGDRLAAGYPEPMVDHKTERETTLELFKAHRARKGAASGSHR